MLNTFKKLPESRKNQILKAAAEVFAHKGYFQAGVDDLCAKAGISNGAFYKYFKNKESLFVTIFNFVVEGMVSMLFLKEADPEASIYERVKIIFNELSVLSKEHPEMVMIYVNLGSCAMNKFAQSFSEKIERESKQYWLNLVTRGKKRGDIRKGVNNIEAAYFIDTQFTMLAHSLVSTSFNIRFKVFFGENEKDVPDKQMIDIMVNSIREFLQK